MKLTKQQLKQIIKEELESVMAENIPNKHQVKANRLAANLILKYLATSHPEGMRIMLDPSRLYGAQKREMQEIAGWLGELTDYGDSPEMAKSYGGRRMVNDAAMAMSEYGIDVMDPKKFDEFVQMIGRDMGNLGTDFLFPQDVNQRDVAKEYLEQVREHVPKTSKKWTKDAGYYQESKRRRRTRK